MEQEDLTKLARSCVPYAHTTIRSCRSEKIPCRVESQAEDGS
jgi:hypothetical protein